MTIQSKQEILEILTMPQQTFWEQVAPAARAVCQAHFGDRLLVTAMLAYTNVCKNQCLYCGMRAGSPIPRYRIPPEEILALSTRAREDGLGRMFLLAGEDRHYGFDRLLTMIEGLRQQGYTVALGAGELEQQQYQELAAAGQLSAAESLHRLPQTAALRPVGPGRRDAAGLGKHRGLARADVGRAGR